MVSPAESTLNRDSWRPPWSW